MIIAIILKVIVLYCIAVREERRAARRGGECGGREGLGVVWSLWYVGAGACGRDRPFRLSCVHGKGEIFPPVVIPLLFLFQVMPRVVYRVFGKLVRK